jgi:hypothetical protein
VFQLLNSAGLVTVLRSLDHTLNQAWWARVIIGQVEASIFTAVMQREIRRIN